MKPTASSLATRALLLGAVLLVAGCAAPQESDERGTDAGDVDANATDTGAPDRGIRPVLPTFDPSGANATAGAGNATTISP